MGGHPERVAAQYAGEPLRASLVTVWLLVLMLGIGLWGVAGFVVIILRGM